MALFEALLLRRVTLGLVRMIRKLLVTAVVLVALAAAGNVVLGRYAEHKAAAQIKTSLKLSSTPSVHFDAFPIALRLLQGSIPHTTVEADDVGVHDLVVSHFHLSVDDLRVSLGDLTAGRGRLRVGGGDAYGEVSQDDANAYLAKQQQDVRVTFAGDRVSVRTRATYAGRAHDLEATGSLSLDGTDLVFIPTRVTMDGGAPPPAVQARAKQDTSFRVPIPALPGGIRPKRVTVRGGFARLDVEFGATTLDLGAL